MAAAQVLPPGLGRRGGRTHYTRPVQRTFAFGRQRNSSSDKLATTAAAAVTAAATARAVNTRGSRNLSYVMELLAGKKQYASPSDGSCTVTTYPGCAS